MSLSLNSGSSYATIAQHNSIVIGKRAAPTTPASPSHTTTALSSPGSKPHSVSVGGHRLSVDAKTLLKPSPPLNGHRPKAQSAPQLSMLNGKPYTPPPNVAAMLNSSTGTAAASALGRPLSAVLQQLNPEEDSLSTPCDPTRGAKLKTKLKDHTGQETITHTAKRASTKDMLHGELNSKFAFLTGKLDTAIGAEKEEILVELEILKIRRAKIDNPQLKGVDWFSTNSLKKLFQKFGSAEAKRRYVPLLMNLRAEHVKYKNETISSVTRSGSMCDFAHLETSLFEMHDYGLLKNLQDKIRQTEASQAEQLDILKELINDKAQTTGKAPEQELTRLQAQYDLLTPAGELKTVDILITCNRIEENIKAAYDYDPHLLTADGSIKQATLDAKIKEREGNLDSQFLQNLLHEHKNRPKNQPQNANETYRYNRLGLLNTKKDAAIANVSAFAKVGALLTGKEVKQDKAQVLSEKNMCLDTYEAVARQNGKTLVYDQADENSAFVYQNEIHLPQCYAPDKDSTALTDTSSPPKPITRKLAANFSNVSLTGDTTNTGVQAWVNQQSLPQLGHMLTELETEINKMAKDPKKGGRTPEQLVQLKRDLNHAKKLHTQLEQSLANGEGGIRNVEKMALLQSLVGNLAVNCYGGKDRTGYVCAMLAHFNIHKCLNNIGVDADLLKTTIKRVGRDLLADTSIALQVANDNIGWKAIKLFFTEDLGLLSGRVAGEDTKQEHSHKGTLKQAKLAFNAFATFLQGMPGIDHIVTPAEINRGGGSFEAATAA